MEKVQFLDIDDEEPDLILSFALDDSGLGIKSLVLQRTPKYEVLMPEDERGVHVSLEGDEDIERNLLVSIKIEAVTVTISTTQRTYKLDTINIEETQIKQMLYIIKKLNFDSRFEVIMTK